MVDNKPDVVTDTKPAAAPPEPAGLHGQATQLLASPEGATATAAAKAQDNSTFVVMSNPFDASKAQGGEVSTMGFRKAPESDANSGLVDNLKRAVGDNLARKFGEIFPGLFKEGMKPPDPEVPAPGYSYAHPGVPRGWENVAKDLTGLVSELGMCTPGQAKELVQFLVGFGYHRFPPEPAQGGGRDNHIDPISPPGQGARYLNPIWNPGQGGGQSPGPGGGQLRRPEPVIGRPVTAPYPPNADDSGKIIDGGTGGTPGGRPGNDSGDPNWGHGTIGGRIHDRIKDPPGISEEEKWRQRAEKERELTQLERTHGLTPEQQRTLNNLIAQREMHEKAEREQRRKGPIHSY